MTGRRARDEGSGTVWFLVLFLAWCGSFALLVTGAVVVSTRHRAAAAADLAALAAAGRLAVGQSEPAACSQASAVARAAGATLVACHQDTAAASVVEVRATAQFPFLGSFEAKVRARAGPEPFVSKMSPKRW